MCFNERFKRSANFILLITFLILAPDVSYAQQSDAQVIKNEKQIKTTGEIIQQALADQKAELDGLVSNRIKIVKNSKYTKNRIAALNYIGTLCNTKTQTADDLSAVAYAAASNEKDVTVKALAITYYGLCKSDYATDKLLAAYVMQGTTLAKAKFVYSTVDPFGILTFLGNETEEELKKDYILINGAVKGLVLSKTTLSVTLLEDLNNKYIEDKVLGKLDRKTYEPESYASKIQVDILEGIASKIKDYGYKTAEIPYLEKQITATEDLPTYDVTAKGAATLLLAKMDCNKSTSYANETGCVKGLTKESVTTSLQTIVLSNSWPNDLRLLAYGELKKYYPEQQVFTATGNVNMLVLGQNYQKLLNYALEEEKINNGIMAIEEFVISWYAGNYIFELVASGTAAIFGKIFAKMGDEAAIAAANEAKIAADAAKALEKEQELVKDAKWIEEAKQGLHQDTWSGQQYYKEAQKVAEQDSKLGLSSKSQALNTKGETLIKTPSGGYLSTEPSFTNYEVVESNLSKGPAITSSTKDVDVPATNSSLSTTKKITEQDILTKFADKIPDKNGADVVKIMEQRNTVEELSKMTLEEFDIEYTAAKHSLGTNISSIESLAEIDKKEVMALSDSFNALQNKGGSRLTTVDDVIEAENRLTRELKEIGIDKKGLGISLPLNLEGLQDYRAYIPPVKEGFKFPIYNIDARNLPEIKGIAKPFTLALQHPDLPEFLAKLHEKGYRYLVDSSLPLSDARAVHFGYAKSINMPVRGTWLTFVHEFSHFEWNIAMKDLQALCIKQGNKVYWSDVLRGKSSIDGLSDLIIQHPIIKEAIEFVKQTGLGQIPVGFTAVNESIAVKRQIELLQQYGYNTLDGDESLSPREYAAEHQIDDAQEQLNTIDKQEKEGVSGEYADRLQLIKQQLRETRQIAQEDLFFIKNIRNARTAEDAKAKNALTNKLLAIYGARFFVTVGGAAYIAYFVSQNRYEIKDKLNEWFGPNQQPEQIKVFYNEAEKTYVMLAGKDNIIIPIDKTKVDTKSNLMVIPEEVNGRKVVIHFGKAKK